MWHCLCFHCHDFKREFKLFVWCICHIYIALWHSLPVCPPSSLCALEIDPYLIWTESISKEPPTPSDCCSFAEGLLSYDIDFLLCLVTCSFLKIQLKGPPFRKFLKSYLSIIWALCAANITLKYFYLWHLYVVVFHGSVSCLCSKPLGDRGHILCQLLYLIQCWV